MVQIFCFQQQADILYFYDFPRLFAQILLW